MPRYSSTYDKIAIPFAQQITALEKTKHLPEYHDNDEHIVREANTDTIMKMEAIEYQ